MTYVVAIEPPTTARISSGVSPLASGRFVARRENEHSFEVSPKDRALLGGKGAQLAWLARHGFAVPQTHVLSTLAFKSQVRGLRPAHELRSVLRGDERDRLTRGAAAQKALQELAIDPAVLRSLRRYYDAMEASAPFGFAVRSSATVEDQPGHSLAGLAETRLSVHGFDAFCEAIRAVWGSLYTGRALTYLTQRGVREAAMAVVLQPMIDARVSGVLFTRARSVASSSRESGISFSPDDLLVNVALGLGTSVVDGHGTPDEYRLRRDGTLLAHRRGRAFSADESPVLREAELRALATATRALGFPEEPSKLGGYDVEFCFDQKDALCILQIRAVKDQLPEGGTPDTLWSRANVGEALPGAATPLTWSVAAAFSEEGFRRAFQSLGCTVPKNAVFVGNIYGRFYLNLTEFLGTAAQVPWLDPRRLVELGGGLGALSVAPAELGGTRGKIQAGRFWLRAPFLAKRLAEEQLRLRGEVTRFENEARVFVDQFHALDLGILPDEALAKRWRFVERWLERTGHIMLSCASAALGAHLILERALSLLAPANGVTAEQLTAGIADLVSAKPAFDLRLVAREIRRDPPAQMYFETLGDHGAPSLEAWPDGESKRAFCRFLKAHGERGPSEVELARPRWKEDPRPLLWMLLAAVKAGDEATSPAGAGASSGSDRGVSSSRSARGEPTSVGGPVLRRIVHHTRESVALRERTRGWVTRVLGLLREVALEANARLRALMPALKDVDAYGIPSVFFLTAEEVVHALAQARTDLVATVTSRHATFLRDASRPEPPPTFRGIPTRSAAPSEAPLAAATEPAKVDVAELRGLAASRGVVRGRVRVLSDVDGIPAFRPGEILVTRATDVGWTPLFPLAGAVVTELGGVLSHAAIVARELDVPCVVSVARALSELRTGDFVVVDGDRGIVQRVNCDNSGVQS